MWKSIAVVRNSNLPPVPPQGGGASPQWGTFVPNQPILMKFGMSCPYSCGNGLLLSEIQIPPPFPHPGEGGGFVARGPEMYEDE